LCSLLEAARASSLAAELEEEELEEEELELPAEASLAPGRVTATRVSQRRHCAPKDTPVLTRAPTPERLSLSRANLQEPRLAASGGCRYTFSNSSLCRLLGSMPCSSSSASSSSSSSASSSSSTWKLLAKGSRLWLSLSWLSCSLSASRAAR
jgi:hypothetical protein